MRFRTNAVRRRATHWRPHRHPTRRPGRPRAAPPNAPAAPHAPAHESEADRLRAMRRMLSNCVPATTCSRSAPEPTHLDAHRVVAFMQREHVCTDSRSGGQRQRIPVGPHAQSHAPTGNEISAVTIGSDPADPDVAVLVARSSHDLAAKPGDLGGMHCRINPQGDRRARPTALKPSRHPTLRMTTDTGCGRGRFDLNRRVLAATA